MDRVLKTAPMGKKGKSLYEGILDGFPISIGYIPISITFGMIAVQEGLHLWQAIAMSVLVFAGASQFMAINMLTIGVGAFEIIFATFILNLRHFILSLSMMNQWKHLSKKSKAFFSFGLTDETYSVFSMKRKQREQDKYYIGGLIGMAYTSWILGTVIGGIFSNFISPLVSVGMSITLYAMFIGLLVPEMKKSWKVTLIALSSILLSIFFNFYFELSSGWSIILSTLMGSSLGILLHKEEKSVEKEVSI